MHTEVKPPAGARTGYSIDVNPTRVPDQELAASVPVASDSGTQAGRKALRDFESKAHYEVLDYDTAMSRARARAAGKMPPIPGGVDDPDSWATGEGAPAQTQVPGEVLDMEARMRISDEIAEPEEEQSLPAPPTSARSAEHSPRITSKVDAYLAGRKRVEFILELGTCSIPVIDVKQTDYGIAVLIPDEMQGAFFMPSVGTELKIGFEDTESACYYTGVAVRIEELGARILLFAKGKLS